MKRVSGILAFLAVSACSTVDYADDNHVQLSKEPMEWRPYVSSRNPAEPSKPAKGWATQKTAWRFAPDAESSLSRATDLPPDSEAARADDGITFGKGLQAEGLGGKVSPEMLASVEQAAAEAYLSASGQAVAQDAQLSQEVHVSRVWRGGDCAGIELTAMSPGGSLPILWRISGRYCR